MIPSTRTVVVLAAFALTPCPAARAESAAAAPTAPVDAVWVELEHNFIYLGQTAYYSCDGLRDKVRYILQQAGARPDLKVSMSCVGAGVETTPGVRIKAAFPAEATPERLAQLAAEAPKRELLARVTGNGDQLEADAAQFPAVWRRVEFEGRGRGRIEDGDCELLEQLMERVLVPAGVRVAPESRLSCVPHQLPIGSVRLVLDTLQKAPEPDAPPQERPH
ncbi:MAG TPA: hypothetical protein VFP48_11100 [Steroidobacteraceae bacterium]|nr:hypothetical protein [Steroidobacteraceae bacterium]